MRLNNSRRRAQQYGRPTHHIAVAKAHAPHLLGEATKEATPPPLPVPEEKKDEGGSGERGFRPLPYLQADHPAVSALGFPPEIASAAGIGWAPRGYHRDGVAVPLRTENGLLLGYISLSESGVKLPPKWQL